MVVGKYEEEISMLENLFESQNPEFLALYGRRHIHSTSIIRKFFLKKKVIFFNVTGVKKGSQKEQLAHFSKEIRRVFLDGSSFKAPKNWDDALGALTKAMSQEPTFKKIILFFDKISWMITPKSNLLQSLDDYWKQYWSKNKRIKLIICGSNDS